MPKLIPKQKSKGIYIGYLLNVNKTLAEASGLIGKELEIIVDKSKLIVQEKK